MCCEKWLTHLQFTVLLADDDVKRLLIYHDTSGTSFV